MNPFRSFARNKTKKLFTRPWALLLSLGIFLILFILGLGLLLRLPFQEAIGVPGIIRSEPSTRIIKSPFSGRIAEVLVQPWDIVNEGDSLVVIDQEQFIAERTQYQQAITRLTNEKWVIETLIHTIRLGKPNPFDPNTQAYGNQLYLAFFQEYQVLNQTLRAKDIELTQYQSLPSSMQKQAILTTLGLQLEELDSRLQVFIETYLSQLSHQLKQLVTQQEDFIHVLHQLEIQIESLIIKADIPGQIISLTRYSLGDWVGQGELLMLLLPDKVDQLYIEIEIPQNKRSRIDLPSPIRFFSQDGNLRNTSLVESQIIQITEQPVTQRSQGPQGIKDPVFIGRAVIEVDDYPWLVPETTGLAWIQGVQLSLFHWIVNLLDVTFSQGYWWQRARERRGTGYSNPQKLPSTSFLPFDRKNGRL